MPNIERNEYVADQVTVIIDNEEQQINIYDINKFPTHFQINNIIETISLYQDINLDIFLEYEDDSIMQPIEKGFVYLYITDLSQKKIYQKEKISFIDGSIIKQISHNLSLGEYLLQIQYLGNKYYEEQSLTIQFTIEKREIKCIFNKQNYEVYPNQEYSLGVTLIDNLTNKKIKNCPFYYYFNDKKYFTQTNINGYSLLSITTPSINPELCVQKNKLIYPLNIELESTIYELIGNTEINIEIKKYPTEIFISTNNDDFDFSIKGNVIAYDEDEIFNVEHGIINLNIEDTNQQINTTTDIDENGFFNINIENFQIKKNNFEYVEPIICSTAVNTVITLESNKTTIELEDDRQNTIKFNANVVTEYNNPILYGMVTFIITQNEEEVYRYITELDQGKAYFNFNVTTVGEYEVQAIYHQFCEYQTSESNIIEYNVIKNE